MIGTGYQTFFDLVVTIISKSMYGLKYYGLSLKSRNKPNPNCFFMKIKKKVGNRSKLEKNVIRMKPTRLLNC